MVNENNQHTVLQDMYLIYEEIDLIMAWYG